MARTTRQSKILDLIKNNEIDTQEELVTKLKSEDFNVTQATISRDIKELGLTKILTESGKYKYIHVEGGSSKISNKIINVFKESVISIESANNLMVIKTLAGSANAASILIDKLGMNEILGTIAGDDTLLIIAKETENVKTIKERIAEITG